MSRYGIDPPDDDAYDIRYDGTDCADCGCPAVAWLCETCSDQRESWAAATEIRMAAIRNPQSVVEVALVPISQSCDNAVVEVAIVPIAQRDARFLKRMAKAILSADLSHIQEVA